MKRRRGQALVEFSLVSMALFLLTFLLIDGGRLVYSQTTLAEAAREGAHMAELEASSDTQVRVAINDHSGILGDLGSNASISTPRLPGQPATVTVRSRLRPISPFFDQYQLDLSASTTVVVE